jgi:hypothetical protein
VPLLLTANTYVLWKTLAQMCKVAGLGDEPRRVFEELAKIKAVDVVLPIDLAATSSAAA